MPVTPESIGQAIMDVQRRKRDMPTRQENVEALALAAIKKKQEMAALGLSEEELANRPELRGQESAESGGKVAKLGEETRAAGSLADLRDKQALHTGDRVQSPGSTFYGEGAEEAGVTAPMTPAQSVAGQPKTISEHFQDADGKWKVRQVISAPGVVTNMKPTSGMLQREERMGKVKDIVTELGGLALEINTVPGTMGRIVGNYRKIKAMFNLDPDVQVYGDTLAGAASQLAKAFGESGRLSDQDIQRTVNMFPRVGDSPEVSQRKLDIIDILVGEVFSGNEGAIDEVQLAANSALVAKSEAMIAKLVAEDPSGVNRAMDVANAGGGGGESTKTIGGVTWVELPDGSWQEQ